jgi:Zn-dependent protease
MNFFETSGWKIGSLFGVDISLSMGFLFIVGLNIVLAGVYVGLIFAITLFVSLIIHEMGHAVVAKHYKLEPSILLHGFGGLCFHRPAATDGQDALIVFAGPLAQIGAGLGTLALMTFAPLPAIALDFATYFTWISLLWGGLNLLLPIYPLDGGKLFHLLLRRFKDSATALEWALKVSIVVSIPLGIFALTRGWYIGAFLVMFIIMDNVNGLKAGASADPRPQVKRESDFVKGLISEAGKAFEAGEFREAYRLCHQARADGDTMSKKTQAKMWEILTLATIEIGELDEARGWLKRAPDTEKIRIARGVLEVL